MNKIIQNGQSFGFGTDVASAVSYNNSSSRLSATNVQSAIDEVNNNLTQLPTFVKRGIVQIDASHINPNEQYIFTVEDANIRYTDIVLATVFVNGASSKGVTTRCNCNAGNATLRFLTTEDYGHSTNIIVGFNYLILR